MKDTVMHIKKQCFTFPFMHQQSNVKPLTKSENWKEKDFDQHFVFYCLITCSYLYNILIKMEIISGPLSGIFQLI